jgi:PAS domain S-box-containing protein
VLPPLLAARLLSGAVSTGVIAAWLGLSRAVAPALSLVGLFGVYALAIWAVVRLAGERHAVGGTYTVLVLDALALGCALALIGGLETPLVGLYGLVVLTAGIVAGARCAVGIGALSLLVYGAALYLARSPAWPDPWLGAGLQRGASGSFERYLVFSVVIVTAALVASFSWVERMRARLVGAEVRYRKLFEGVSDPILVWDPKTLEVLDVNVAAVRASGWPRERLLSPGGLERILLGASPAQESCLGSGEEGGGSPMHRYVRPDGEERFFSVSASRIDYGEASAAVALMRDLTDRYRLEQEQHRQAEHLQREVQRRTSELTRANEKLRELQLALLRAQRLGATEHLAASVAHAINNPLAALIGTVELMARSSRGADPALERVLRLALRIRTVAARTLELFRKGTLELRPEPPARIVERVREELAGRARTQRVELDVKVESGLPSILVDRALLGAALVGIAENGIEAMPEGGHLWIEAESVRSANVVRFRVSDNGGGVPLELRDKVFEPFFTTKRAGTGLGLAIAKGVIEGHRGNVRIGDRPGGGTSVTIDLPSRPEIR